MYICLSLKRIIELLQNQKAHDNQAWIAHTTEKQLTSLTPKASWKSILRILSRRRGRGGTRIQTIKKTSERHEQVVHREGNRLDSYYVEMCSISHEMNRDSKLANMLGCGCGESDTRLCWECVAFRVCWGRCGMVCLFRSRVKLLRKALRTYFQ